MDLADAPPVPRTVSRRPSCPADSHVPRMSEFRAPAEIQCIRDMRRYVYDAGHRLDVPRKTLDAFSTALTELASNVIRHPQPPATHLRLTLELGRNGLTATFCADADSFADRHTLFTHARPPAHMPSPSPSGRGLYIALCLFPFLDYQPRSDRSDGYECYTLSGDIERRTSPG